MCANGPLAWSVLAFNHAMIFHSYVSWMHSLNLFHSNPARRKWLLLCSFVWHLWVGGKGSHDFSCGARLSSASIIRSSVVCSTNVRFHGSTTLPHLWRRCWKLFGCLLPNIALWNDDTVLPVVADSLLCLDLCGVGLIHRTPRLPDIVGPHIGLMLSMVGVHMGSRWRQMLSWWNICEIYWKMV